MVAKTDAALISPLDGIDLKALGFPPIDAPQARLCATLLQARGPLDTGQLIKLASQDRPRQLKRLLTIGKKAGIFSRKGQTKPWPGSPGKTLFAFSQWALNTKGVASAACKYPAPPTEQTMSVEDAKHHLAGIHELQTGLGVIDCQGICRAAVRLAKGPAAVGELHDLLGYKSQLTTTTLLNSAVRDPLGIFGREHGTGVPSVYYLRPSRVETLSNRLPRKPLAIWPLYKLTPSMRASIESVHFEDDALTNAQAWWVANYMAMIYLSGGRVRRRLRDFARDHGVNHGSLLQYIYLAEEKGYVLVESPELKGKQTRPSPWRQVNEAKLASLRSGELPAQPLTPGRSQTPIGELIPESDARSDAQRALVDAIDFHLIGLNDRGVKKLLRIDLETWRDFRTVLKVCGDEFDGYAEQFAQAIGCAHHRWTGLSSKLKPAGLVSISRGRITPNWRRLGLIAGDAAKAAVNGSGKRGSSAAAGKGSSPAAANGADPTAVPNGQAPIKKRTPGRRGDWDDACAEVNRYLTEHPASTLADALKDYAAKTPSRLAPDLEQLKNALKHRRRKARIGGGVKIG